MPCTELVGPKLSKSNARQLNLPGSTSFQRCEAGVSQANTASPRKTCPRARFSIGCHEPKVFRSRLATTVDAPQIPVVRSMWLRHHKRKS